MADPFQPVSQGSPLTISAKTWNAQLQAAKDYSRRKYGEGTGPSGVDSRELPLLMLNTLYADLPECSIVGFGEPAIDPGSYTLEVARQPIIGTAWPVIGQPFAVLRDPLPSGRIGEAIASGVALVKLNVLDETHTAADVLTPGTTDYLTSSDSGGAAILWKQSGTGLVWALVRVGGAIGHVSLLSGATIGATAPNAIGTVVVDGLGDVPVYNQWPTAIPEAKLCVIGWMALEHRYQFIAVAC